MLDLGARTVSVEEQTLAFRLESSLCSKSLLATRNESYPVSNCWIWSGGMTSMAPPTSLRSTSANCDARSEASGLRRFEALDTNSNPFRVCPPLFGSRVLS